MIEKENMFYKDIMSQNFSIGTFYNPTRYILLYALINNGKIKREYDKSDLAQYIFSAYCSNSEIAKHHPNIEIRKIPFYGIQSIYFDLEIALKDWVNDAKYNILTYDLKKVFIDLDDNDGHVAEYIRKILSVLFAKNFSQNFIGIKSVNTEILLSDTDLEKFGKSYFRNLVFSDMQYCVLCDECNEKNLYCVHIVNSHRTSDLNILSDSNNGILMCKKHAQMYIDNLFSFDERGKVIQTNDDDIKNARISNKIFVKRKIYFEKLNEINNHINL